MNLYLDLEVVAVGGYREVDFTSHQSIQQRRPQQEGKSHTKKYTKKLQMPTRVTKYYHIVTMKCNNEQKSFKVHLTILSPALKIMKWFILPLLIT